MFDSYECRFVVMVVLMEVNLNFGDECRRVMLIIIRSSRDVVPIVVVIMSF